LEEAVVALMIEKKEAVENLDAILSVKGIDMVQFGPGDYSMSTGLAGQFDHPQVREAERYIIETALRKGIAPRAEISHPSEAERYLEMGVRHFCMGEDVGVLYEYYKGEGGAMRELLSRV
jgi:4-hydroxy-2-oxoheptanedioate aldolase